MRNKGKRARVFVNIVFILYIFCLLRIVLFKRVTLIELFKYGINPQNRLLYLKPFAGVVDMFNGVYSFFSVFQNYVGNLVLFIPLGIIINYFSKKTSYKRSLLYGILLSISFEIIQYIFAIGTSDINDVIMNSSGAVLGCFIYKIILDKSKNRNSVRKNTAIFILGIIIMSIMYIVCIMNFEKTHVRTVITNKEIISYLKDVRNERGTFVSFEDGYITVRNNITSKESKYKVSSNAKYYCVEHREVYGDFANNVVSNHFNYYQVSYNYFSKDKCIKDKTQVKVFIKNNMVKAIVFVVEKNKEVS